MNGELLQPKIQRGYAKCAQKIGSQFMLFRSPSPINPVYQQYNIGPILMSANVSWDYMKSKRYGAAVWNLIIDTAAFPNYYIPVLEPNGCLNYLNPVTLSLGDQNQPYANV